MNFYISHSNIIIKKNKKLSLEIKHYKIFNFLTIMKVIIFTIFKSIN